MVNESVTFMQMLDYKGYGPPLLASCWLAGWPAGWPGWPGWPAGEGMNEYTSYAHRSLVLLAV